MPTTGPTNPELDEPAVRAAGDPRRGEHSLGGHEQGRRAPDHPAGEIEHDWSGQFGPDPGLVKDGVEAHLQELLAEQVHTFGENWTLVRREFPTAIGPVDLLCRDDSGAAIAVEVKRRGEIDGVEQLTRYLSCSTAIHCWPR